MYTDGHVSGQRGSGGGMVARMGRRPQGQWGGEGVAGHGFVTYERLWRGMLMHVCTRQQRQGAVVVVEVRSDGRAVPGRKLGGG